MHSRVFILFSLVLTTLVKLQAQQSVGETDANGIRSGEYTITCLVHRGAGQFDNNTANELRSRVRPQLEALGFHIIDGDMTSNLAGKTIIITMSISGEGRKAKEAYIIELRSPEHGSLFRARADTLDKLLAKLAEE